MSFAPTRVALVARELPKMLRIGRRGLVMVAGGAPGTAIAYVALAVGLAALPVLQVWLAKLVVDEVATGLDGTTRQALFLAALYALTLLAPAALAPIQRTLVAWLEDRAVAEVDRRLMGAGVRLEDLVRLERPAFQDELRTVQESVYQAPRFFMFMENALGNTITLAGLLALLAQLHPLLPIALAAFAIPRMIIEQRTGWLAYEAMARRSHAAREMDYCARVATEPGDAKEVRVFGLGDFFLARFEDRFRAALSEVTGVRLRYLRLSALFGGLQALSVAGGFWYVASRVGVGEGDRGLSMGDLALYLSAIMQAQAATQFMSLSYGMLYETLLHLRGLFDFLDNARQLIALPPPGTARAAPNRLSASVELKDVRFHYPEGERPVLEEASFTLRAGEVTALVGANGAGKSTIVKLLTRMYDPTEGEILLDGVPLREYDLEGLRRRVAVAYQDFARFSLSLRENVAVGAVEPGRADGGVEAAARLSGADEVAAKLERGYDTELTRRFEGGVELSGGEWQKVGLARGFVRDAALVILDEPTSALDADAEHRLFERFRDLVRGRTALIISHRFSTVRTADRIVVLEEGRIVEQGTHAELVAAGGRYAELFEMQAGRYR